MCAPLCPVLSPQCVTQEQEATPAPPVVLGITRRAAPAQCASHALSLAKQQTVGARQRAQSSQVGVPD